MKYQVAVEGRAFEIEVAPDGRVWVNGQSCRVNLQGINGLPQYSLLVDHRSFEALAEEEGICWVGGRPYQVRLQRKRSRPVTASARPTRQPAQIVAPLPGLLVEVRATEGQMVKKGEVVLVLESMKMNLELRAPRSGVVQALCAAVGQEVTGGEVLAVIGRQATDDERRMTDHS